MEVNTHGRKINKVGIATRFKTQQQIADMIDNTLTEDKQTERENAAYLRGGSCT